MLPESGEGGQVRLSHGNDTDLIEVKQGAMQYSMEGAFPAKRTAVLFTEKGMWTTSFSNWGLGALFLRV